MTIYLQICNMFGPIKGFCELEAPVVYLLAAAAKSSNAVFAKNTEFPLRLRKETLQTHHSIKTSLAEPFLLHSNNLYSGVRSCQERGVHTTGSVSQFQSKDYYSILGIHKNANQGQIKKAYFDLCKIYHPDVNKQEHARTIFTRVSEAYEVLGHVRRRRLYDRGVISPGTGAAAQARAAEQAEMEHEADLESFKKWSGGQARGDIPTGKSKVFDFDEYYRKHYGSLLNKRHKAMRRNAESEHGTQDKRDIAEANDHVLRGAIALVGSLAALTFYILMGRKATGVRPPRFPGGRPPFP